MIKKTCCMKYSEDNSLNSEIPLKNADTNRHLIMPIEINEGLKALYLNLKSNSSNRENLKEEIRSNIIKKEKSPKRVMIRLDNIEECSTSINEFASIIKTVKYKLKHI